MGEYNLENGMVLVIEEEGLIKEVKSSESEEAPEVEVEVEAKEEEMAYATKEELAEVKSMIEEIKAMLEPKKEEEISEEVSEVKEELSSELPKEVLAELSQPAVEPINTNAEVVKQKVQFNIASKRTSSTMDRVMSKLNNNK